MPAVSVVICPASTAGSVSVPSLLLGDMSCIWSSVGSLMVALIVDARSSLTIVPVALERAKADKEAHGEFESECPGYCGAQDTFYVGTMKGVGRIYQQTFIDTYAKVAFAKLYDRKTPITAADLLNDRVLPFFDEHDIRLRSIA